MTFPKPPIDVDRQIAILEEKGVIVNDKTFAINVLNNISHYRISQYLEPFRDHSLTNEVFFNNIPFEKAIKVYSFDRKLRLLLFNEISIIEIAIRNQMSLILSIGFGPDWYGKNDLFSKIEILDIQHSFKNEFRRSKEEFFREYRTDEAVTIFPPSWVALEIFTIGQLSRTYKYLKDSKEKKDIAAYFKLPIPIMESWLHTICYIRNICAHHARMWNKTLAIRPKTHRDFDFFNHEMSGRRLYSSICVIIYFLDIVHPSNSFRKKIKKILENYQDVVNPSRMGFPLNWGELDFWNKES